jgi:hypothetical protein
LYQTTKKAHREKPAKGFATLVENNFMPSDLYTRAHSFGHILTKKFEISRTFDLKKYALLSWSSFVQFCQKHVLFLKVRDISRFERREVLPCAF